MWSVQHYPVQVGAMGQANGIQHVPALMLLNLCQELSNLHLKNYTVLDCEPLHYIKGPLGNLVKEFTYILHQVMKTLCKEVSQANTKENITGSKKSYRKCNNSATD